MTKNFDKLFEGLICELSPVDADYGAFSTSLKDKIGSAPGRGYLIGTIADALGVTREDVIDKISQKLFDRLFENGRNEANTEEEYREAISTVLKGIVEDLKTENPDAKIPSAAAIRGYTARIISSIAEVTKDFSGMPSKPAVKAAVQQAAEPNKEESDEEMEETSEVEFVYRKAADCNSDDAALCKVWNKLPSDRDLDWSQVCKYVGMTNANQLIDCGAIVEVEKEVDRDQEGTFDALEQGAEVGDLDVHKAHREVNPYFDRTESPYRHEEY